MLAGFSLRTEWKTSGVNTRNRRTFIVVKLGQKSHIAQVFLFPVFKC